MDKLHLWIVVVDKFNADKFFFVSDWASLRLAKLRQSETV
jgi:hypothetical protein